MVRYFLYRCDPHKKLGMVGWHSSVYPALLGGDGRFSGAVLLLCDPVHLHTLFPLPFTIPHHFVYSSGVFRDAEPAIGSAHGMDTNGLEYVPMEAAKSQVYGVGPAVGTQEELLL